MLDNSNAVLYDAANNSLLFELPYIRPKQLSDISLEVQRRFTASFDFSGNATIPLFVY